MLSLCIIIARYMHDIHMILKFNWLVACVSPIDA